MNDIKLKLTNFLEEHRGLVVVVFCLPASIIFNFVTKLILTLNIYFTEFFKGNDHSSRVKYIQKQVNNWKNSGSNKYLVNARPNWLSLSTKFFKKHEHHRVNVPLHQIVALDEENHTVTVEPYVTIGEITKYLVPRGYMLACTIEIEDATCGGLAMGVGMSTHSHKVGLYQETIKCFEVVMPSGEVIEATADNEHSDLFSSLPWSHGSLALLVSLKLQIIPIQPYLHLKYKPVFQMEKYCSEIRNLSGALSSSNNNNQDLVPDFLEATVFSKDKAVIMMGNFIDSDRVTASGLPINHVNTWYKPYFYKHVEKYLNKSPNSDGISGEEIIPIEEYLFRHNRAIFWVLEAIIPFCNDFLFRLIFGWMCPPKPAFLKFTTTQGIRELTFVKQVFQDIVLPMTVLEKSIETSERLFDLYPILIYPCRVYSRPNNKSILRNPREDQMTPGTDYGMFYDLGVYGVPGYVKRKEYYDAGYAMTSIEKFIRDNGGYSFLYADIFLNRTEFEEMFDLSTYEKVRKKYKLESAFPHLYEKVKPECDVIKISRRHADYSRIHDKKTD